MVFAADCKTPEVFHMPVNLYAPDSESLLPIAGLRLGVTMAGIRKPNRRDLTVLLLDEGCSVGGVFTENRCCAAPVTVCRERLDTNTSDIRALMINTGNANAGTGEAGMRDCLRTSAALAELLHIEPEQVLPFSTGVIIEPLPADRIIAGLPDAVANATDGNWLHAAQGIMTTDTLPKATSIATVLDGTPVTITGISKGSGMIHPNMATMLGFIATDACVAPELMPVLTRRLADMSFNRITVDGDTSTNDSFIVIATNRAGHAPVTDLDSAAGQQLLAALTPVAQTLAQAIVRDGEGATKFITITVAGGKTRGEAQKVAYAIAHSPLVKTAFYASDPNLGRILAAIGYAGIADLDQHGISMHLDDVHVISGGGRHPDYCEEDGQRVMQQDEITVRVDLGRGGSAEHTIWTCDLSHAYVSINADYRS